MLVQLARAVEYTDCISAEGKPTTPNEFPITKNYLGALDNVGHPFIAIAFRSTLIQSGYTWLVPIYGSNRTVWPLNCVQNNSWYLIELFVIHINDLNQNQSLYTHISRIYPYTVNVNKNLFRLSLKGKEFHMYKSYIYIYIYVCVCVCVYGEGC